MTRPLLASLVAVSRSLVGLLVPLLAPLEVCPKPPPGAQKYANDITGYVLWAVIALFGVAIVVAIGGIVGGRVFNMPHASKAGAVGIFVVIVCAIAYVVGPSIVDGILGKGCVG